MSKSAGHHGIVLCIGSHPVRLNLRTCFLKDHGWTVLTSGNGHDGIQRFTTERVDIVVLDLEDHGTESVLIASQIKRLRPNVPIILLDGHGTALPKEAQSCTDCIVGADDHKALLGALENLS